MGGRMKWIRRSEESNVGHLTNSKIQKIGIVRREMPTRTHAQKREIADLALACKAR
jgi:hypothetical protein